MENKALKTIRVNLLKVAVKSFSPNDNRIVLDIYFEDGKSKLITRTTRLGDANLLALQLLEELELKEKNDCAEFDGEAIHDVDVIVENEQKSRLLLIDFFRTLHSKAQQIKNTSSASGYLDMIRGLQMMQMKLYD